MPQEQQWIDRLIQWVSHNCIEDCFPQKRADIINTFALDLSGKHLTTLPREIGNLKQLTFLAVDNNQIAYLPSEIGNLTNLLFLKLDHNQLVALPAEIGNLTHLTTLSISNNKLIKLPPEIGNLTQLVQLNLDYNLLSKLPQNISNFTKLNQLLLGANYLRVNELSKANCIYEKWLAIAPKADVILFDGDHCAVALNYDTQKKYAA